MDVRGRVGGRARRSAEREPKDAFRVALNRLVVEGLPEPVTLGEVAESLGQQPSTVTRRLQRQFGMSFTQYVGRLRVDKAKDLLRRTKLTVGQVARRVGIDDASNFGKLFRKFEGMAPLEYRKRFGGSPGRKR